MATTEDISWGSYRHYEGPFYRGKHGFKLSEDPSEEEKILAVVTATEGGRYDAINMYDGAPVLSSGLIQFIEGGYFCVSQMLAHAMEHAPRARDGFYAFMKPRGYSLSRRGGQGRWYFYDYDGEKIDARDEQDAFFRGGSNGAKGTWSDDRKRLAKDWAAAVASVWEQPAAQSAQRAYTIPRLKGFAFGESRKWIKLAEEDGSPVALAFVAAYLTFAVNNPTRANKHLDIATRQYWNDGWSIEWLIDMLRELTFGPKIAIYPHRYNAIRKPLERLYGIDLPDFADELKTWTQETGFTSFLDTTELQKALIALGEDLGPAGADGKYGGMTRNALLNFELQSGVPKEFCDGMIDEYTYPKLEGALQAKGVELLGESS